MFEQGQRVKVVAGTYKDCDGNRQTLSSDTVGVVTKISNEYITVSLYQGDLILRIIPNIQAVG